MTRTLISAAVFVTGSPSWASDHAEADGVRVDLIADLDDLYAWHTLDGKVVVAVTFGGAQTVFYGVPGVLDDQMIYGVHVDTDADGTAEHEVWVRFGQNAKGGWGVQFTGIPGGNAVVEGPIDLALDAGNGLQAQAGVLDDPFFMDFVGYTDTLLTGTLMFNPLRDTFAGKNANVLVFEMDAAALGSPTFKVWATSARK